MNERPLLSIIIPTHNRSHLLGETIESILNQTYRTWECIIVDDGSTDFTNELMELYCESDNRIKFFHLPKKAQKGPSFCRNFGFGISKGDFIHFMDSDDLYVPKSLETYMTNFKSETDIVISPLGVIKYKTGKFIKHTKIKSDNLIEDYIHGKVAFYVSGPIWKRTFLEKQDELFDEGLSNLDDWDFNLRMLYTKPVIIFIDEVLIKYRQHSNSLSKELNKLNFDEILSEFKAREKHVQLLKKNKLVDASILQHFIVKRYLYFYRLALLNNHEVKHYLFKMLLKKQLRHFNLFSLSKIFLATISYHFFDKGYILLK